MTPLFSSALLRTQSDERLVALAREGHERAFEVIVDRYRKALMRYCERALSRPKSEDVVQQVLMKAWVALQNGAQVRSLKPWLYRITRTTIFETAETPGYDFAELERSLLPADAPESELEQRAVIRKTLAGLAALPEAQREALLRNAFDGQSRAQIAEALGVSEGAVRQLLYRARASLRTAATALLPLPLANWIASLGPVSAGSAFEGGAAGSAGVVGVAKISAILATAGVMATGAGPVPDRHKAQNRPAEARNVEVRKAETKARPAFVVRSTPVHSTPAQAVDQQGNQSRQEGGQSGQVGNQSDSHRNGDTHGGSARGGGERQVSQDQNAHGDGGHAQAPSSVPSGDQANSGGSGSGSNGD